MRQFFQIPIAVRRMKIEDKIFTLSVLCNEQEDGQDGEGCRALSLQRCG